MKKFLSITLIVFFCVCSLVQASSLIETWDSDIGNWAIKDVEGGTAYGSLSWVPNLGGREGVLQITGGPATYIPREDIIYLSGGLADSADYSLGQTIEFDFYASVLPAQLDVYFLHDKGGEDYAWYYTITPSIGWTHFSIPFGGPSAGWYNVNDGRMTANEFWDDIIDIDEIGIKIWYDQNLGGQIYGLDNFDVIPEPETWAMLGIAFASVAFSFRKRLSEQLALVKARFHWKA